MSIGKICTRTAYLADPGEAVQAAAQRMRDESVGSLLVLDGEQRPIGILTDRDVALRVVAPARDPAATTVAQVMTDEPRAVSEETPIEDAVATMRSLGVRRLPVVDGEGRLAGIASLDDVLELVTEEMANLGWIVGHRRPEAGAPAPTPLRRWELDAAAGLQRAAADLEC